MRLQKRWFETAFYISGPDEMATEEMRIYAKGLDDDSKLYLRLR